MGLLGKGLIGLLLGGGSKNSMPSYLRNAPASSGSSRFKNYSCAFCGKRITTSGVPTAATGGRCEYSPHGKHYWQRLD